MINSIIILNLSHNFLINLVYSSRRLSSKIVPPCKSVGTLVSMMIVKNKPEIINKIILCGIPIEDFQEGDEKRYQVLTSISPENILCIQNLNDNHGDYAKASKLIQSINPNVKIISKPRADHEYPFFEEFKSFIKSYLS